jgi:hypothetical protein
MSNSNKQFPAVVPRITCSWCAKPIAPNAARMRLFDSETTRVIGKWLAHFHPECGDLLLDYLEGRTEDATTATLSASGKIAADSTVKQDFPLSSAGGE